MPYRAVLKILISLSIVSLIKGGDELIDCDRFSVYKYGRCVTEKQKVRMDKPVEGDMREPCKEDRDRFVTCYNNHIWKYVGRCNVPKVRPYLELKLHVALVDIDSGYLQFMCEGNGKNIKQFWKNKGPECFKKIDDKIHQRSCPFIDFASTSYDFNNRETCNGMLEFLNCLREHFDTACDDFGKKMVYTYYKSGFLKTPCGHYLKKKDKNTDLEIIYDQSDDELADESADKLADESCSNGSDGDASTSSVGAASASFPFVVFCICKIMILL